MKPLFFTIAFAFVLTFTVFADVETYRVNLDNNGEKELITVQHQFVTIMEGRPPIEMGGIVTVSKSDGSKMGSFSMPDHMDKVEFVSLNKDGFKQIVAWGSGGAHYTNIAIYGYKDGKVYEIFKNGSACGVNTYFDASSPTVKVGSANWGAKVLTEEGKEINWSYASEPLWKVYAWDGENFAYRKDLSTNPEFSEDQELERYLDKAKSLKQGKKEWENRTDEIVEDMFNVEYYFNGYETTYKQWRPLISKLSEYNISGDNPGLFDSHCFFEAYKRELEEKYNTSLDTDDMPTSEINEYFAKRAEKDGYDILVTTLIEDFYVEKGLLSR